ncbi:hypothetical protein [Rubripirellula reticaptiva]|uniref:Secreted protein n=1 Tax=Rubripirellula reticaptiva TaxID=2528013 RepID=A0A5C6EJY5_9BACT|nr:hypothetical protein [Rubripirellula reticaptiva]TWU49128.1 hypothetical protein Poly59_37420 [Rubripirellula reticaptiva]
MKHFAFLALFLLSLSTLVGCGGTPEPAPAAQQDELSQWVDDNPAPEATELEE